VLDDAARVTAAVRAPDFAAAHRLDRGTLAVVGHSLGGFAALMTAAADPSIAAVASITGADFGHLARACRRGPQQRAALVEFFDVETLPLRGTSGEALVAELEEAGAAWSLPALAPRLTGRPVLLVGAERDTVTPARAHHHPLVEAYLAHPLDRLEHHLFRTDHALSDHRVTLARTLLDFLDRNLRGPAGNR
jgi:pimeloyl-ACP methyl ester carboxylesterase